MKTELKNNKINKIKIVVITTIFLFSIFSCNKANADYWGGAMMASVWETMYNKMMKQIENALIASLKQAALQTINQTVSNSISQGASGPMFITNWENFLINDPQRKADLYMNDFFSSITSGRGSSDYLSREGTMLAANYLNSLVGEAKKMTTEASIPKCTMTNASGAFTGNNWSTFTTMVGTDTCNKFGFNNISQNAYASITEKEQKINSAIGQAGQGFLPKMSGNTIITPGSTIAAIQAQTEDLGNKMLAGANSAPEVIASLVARLATRTIQQGIGQAQQYAQREINNQMNGYTQQIRRQTDPRNIFKPNY